MISRRSKISAINNHKHIAQVLKMMLQREITTYIDEQRTGETGLAADSSLPCWEIIGCDSSKKCPAKEHPDLPCWQVAYELDDYRRFFNVCRDCIVHVLKTSGSTVSS